MVSESMLRVLSVFKLTEVVHGFSELQKRSGIARAALWSVLDKLERLGVIQISEGTRKRYVIVNQDIAWLSDLLLRSVHGQNFEALISSWARDRMIRMVDVPIFIAMMVYRGLEGLLMPGTRGGVVTTWDTRVPTSLIFDIAFRPVADLSYEIFKAVENMKKAELKEKLFGSKLQQQEDRGLERWDRKSRGASTRSRKFST